MSERDIQRAILLETCDRVRWQRNNIGVATYPNGSRVAYGVGGPGGSDLIGILRGAGTFIACEVKDPEWEPRGTRDRERWRLQLQYIESVVDDGGIGFVARSVEDVRQSIPLVVRRVKRAKGRVIHLATMRGQRTLCGQPTSGMEVSYLRSTPCRRCRTAEREKRPKVKR